MRTRKERKGTAGRPGPQFNEQVDYYLQLCQLQDYVLQLQDALIRMHSEPVAATLLTLNQPGHAN